VNHGSLFSGIGGFDLAAEWAGYENIFHCEWNPFGQRVLKHYWPNAKSYDDITKTDFSIHRGEIDILTGGFPCQPYSNAGKRLGKEDERHLFPEMLRAIREIQPRFIVGENVSGLVNWNAGMVFNEVQADLEAEGYKVTPFLLPAASLNAPHKRERVWFIAYCGSYGCLRSEKSKEIDNRGIQKGMEKGHVFDSSHGDGISSDTDSLGHRGRSDQSDTDQSEKWEMDQYQKGNGNRIWSKAERCSRTSSGKIREVKSWYNFPTESPICHGDDGLSSRLDRITFPKWRNESIKGGGNAIVPQVAYQIFKAINQFNDQNYGH
jgi:DNA (cytosine-5)-methyltransferase 1